MKPRINVKGLLELEEDVDDLREEVVLNLSEMIWNTMTKQEQRHCLKHPEDFVAILREALKHLHKSIKQRIIQQSN